MPTSGHFAPNFGTIRIVGHLAQAQGDQSVWIDPKSGDRLLADGNEGSRKETRVALPVMELAADCKKGSSDMSGFILACVGLMTLLSIDLLTSPKYLG